MALLVKGAQGHVEILISLLCMAPSCVHLNYNTLRSIDFLSVTDQNLFYPSPQTAATVDAVCIDVVDALFFNLPIRMCPGSWKGGGVQP